MNNKYGLVVFDWDGTLSDSVDRIVISLRNASNCMSLPCLSNKSYRNIIGLSLHEAIKELYPDLGEREINAFRGYYRDAFLKNNTSSLFDNVPALLEALTTSGYQLAIATGKPAQGLKLELQEYGILHYFSALRSADQALSKPNALMLEQLMEMTGFQAHEMVVVGDSIYDMEMALNVSVDRVGVTWGVHSAVELNEYEPLKIVDNLSELTKWLL